MATRLPTADDLGPRPAPQPDTTVAPSSGGVGVLREVAGIGDALMHIDREMTRRRRGADLADALAKATEELGTQAIEFQRDQDYKTAPTRFKGVSNDIGKKYATGLTDPTVRQAFGEQFQHLAVAKQLGVVQQAVKQEADYHVSSLDQSLDTLAVSAANAATAMERSETAKIAKIGIEEKRAGGWITDVQARKFNEKFQQGYFMTLRQRDPVGALTELMDSRNDMDPLLASRLQGELYTAAVQPMAVGLLDSIRFDPSGQSAPPPSYDEALPGLKAALMKRESGGDKDAVSPQGARGSMQIMPETFKQYALPGESFDNDEHRVAAANRKVDDDYRFYKGDIRKVAAAYIGGRGAVTPDGKIRNDVSDAHGTTPAAYAEQVTAMVGASRQYALNMAVASPEGLIQEYLKDPSKPTGNPLVDSLPADQKMGVLRAAQTLASQDLAQYKQAVNGQYKDTVAAYERGLSPLDPTTPEQLIRAHGPVEGTRMAAAQAEAKQYGETVKQAVGMPLSDMMRTLNETRPAAGPGYADAQRRHEQTATAFAQIKKERDNDPSGFVVQNSPQVRQAFESFNAVMSGKSSEADKALAAQQYAQVTLAEQNRLEIGETKILTKPMIDSITRQFMNPNKESSTVNVVDGMANQWGQYYPQVMKELKKSLPPDAITIGLGMQPEAAMKLSEVSKLKPEQLQQGIPETDVKDLTAIITDKLKPLHATIAYQEGGIETYDSYADSAKKLALGYMQSGMSKKDAANKAVDGMVDFKYDYHGTWRVPKEVLGGTLTPTNISTAARAATRELTDTPAALEVPPANVKGLRPEDAAAQWARTVRDNAVWVTSVGDKGLTLYVKSGSGAQPVNGKDGKPISWTWQELTQRGMSQAAFGVFAPIRPGASR